MTATTAAKTLRPLFNSATPSFHSLLLTLPLQAESGMWHQPLTNLAVDPERSCGRPAGLLPQIVEAALPDAPSTRIESYGSCLGLNFNSLGSRDFPVVPRRVKVKGEKRPLPSRTTRHLFLTERLLPKPSSSSGFIQGHEPASSLLCMRPSVQIKEDDSQNDWREEGEDSVLWNQEDEYGCEKKRNNQEREGLHSASNPLLRGQVKRQRRTTSIRHMVAQRAI